VKKEGKKSVHTGSCPDELFPLLRSEMVCVVLIKREKQQKRRRRERGQHSAPIPDGSSGCISFPFNTGLHTLKRRGGQEKKARDGMLRS